VVAIVVIVKRMDPPKPQAVPMSCWSGMVSVVAVNASPSTQPAKKTLNDMRIHARVLVSGPQVAMPSRSVSQVRAFRLILGQSVNLHPRKMVAIPKVSVHCCLIFPIYFARTPEVISPKTQHAPTIEASQPISMKSSDV
jgi:hypothetical protein